jgi:hypothetical protein
MQYLLEEGGADIHDVDKRGNTIWERMMGSNGLREANRMELTALLQVMVLRDDPPHKLVALLSPEEAEVVQAGARLRAHIPAYLVRRRAYVDAHCPLLLPLCAIVHSYMKLTTEEVWATGLGAAP